MVGLINYRPENFEKIKEYLDNAKELDAATQPAGIKNFVYTPKQGKGLISLNTWEGTIYYSPSIEDVELKKGLLKLTR
jgi:hypothetical protein